MGSDNAGPRPNKTRKTRNIAAAMACLAFLMLVFTSPEVLLDETFEDRQIPSGCEQVVNRFYKVQKLSEKHVVLSCHRKFCNSLWGHCDPCMGLGDRMRTLLGDVERFTDAAVSVQLDFTAQGLIKHKPSVYRDPAGWIAELFHFRSYSSRHNGTIELPEPGETIYTTLQNGARLATDFDICYFYALFRPDASLREMVEFHNRALNNISSSSIGIHFRAGDVAAFGLTDTKDVRYEGSLESALITMIHCADNLAARLFPGVNKVSYYLATDSFEAKEFVRRQPGLAHVYTTQIAPTSFRSGIGEYEAWMEMLLLSQRGGLVVNRTPEPYKGPAKYQYSKFAVLAGHLGSLTADQIKFCSI